MTTTDEQTLVTAPFGCVECDHTGLHYDLDAIGREPVISGERHDECEAFEGDVEAAEFIAYCHPMYRWLVYITDDGGLLGRRVIALTIPTAFTTIPAIEFGGTFHLCTDDALDELKADLAAELG